MSNEISFSFRKHGRYMTKSGFVDSSRRVRSLHRQQDDLLVSPHRTSPSRGGLLAALNKSSFSSAALPIPVLDRKSKSFHGTEQPSVISISTNLETKEREHDKQMRLIEVVPRIVDSVGSRCSSLLFSGASDQSKANWAWRKTTRRRCEKRTAASASYLERTGHR